tara:strand:- start:18334 stop:19221 length:888 start_codon:yes stop_codon:yes gene_type:complete
MTVAKNADVAGVQEALVGEIVQRELQAASKLAGMFEDFSNLVGKGSSNVKIPRASSFNVQDRDNATPTPASAQNLTFLFDQIDLDQSKYVYYVIPGDVEQDSKPSYEQTAASRSASAHGRNMDIARIDTLWSEASNANDYDFDSSADDIEQALLDMIEIADLAEMLDDGGRFLIVRPSQRKQLLGVANFVQADKYGDRTPLISGELGAMYGVRAVVVNHQGTVDGVDAGAGLYGDGKMMLVHRESLGFAFHRKPEHDSDKAIEYGAGSMKHTWDVKYGLSALQDGALIVRAYNQP